MRGVFDTLSYFGGLVVGVAFVLALGIGAVAGLVITFFPKVEQESDESY